MPKYACKKYGNSVSSTGSTNAPSSMPEMSEMNRKLTIKMNVIKRSKKEVEQYEKELTEQSAKIQALKESNGCPHDIKKQYEVLEETKRMLPDCQQRLVNAQTDLGLFVKAGSDFQADLLAEAQSLLA